VPQSTDEPGHITAAEPTRSRGTTILQCARTVKHGIAPMTAIAESYVHAAAQDAGAVAELFLCTTAV